jgi:tetratricopeptide (TPR) repeat protein
MMFKTLTAARILVKQGLFEEALNILNDIETEENRLKVMYLKALSLEALNKNDSAEELCYKLIDEKFIEENVYEILEKIFSKKKASVKTEDIDLPESEIAAAYELLGDTESALKWYYKKIQSLKNKLGADSD